MKDGLCVPELPTFAMRVLKLISPGNHCVAIYDLRNALARGQFSQERAVVHLDQHGHRMRFEDFWHDDATKFLCELRLWGLLSHDQAVLKSNGKREESRYRFHLQSESVGEVMP